MQSLRIKERLQLFSLRLLASLRQFLQLLGQRHQPALAPVPVRQQQR